MANSDRNRRRDIDRFDTWSDTYDDSALQKRFFQPLHDHVVKLVTRLASDGGAVLDVGCGTGQLLSRLREALPSAIFYGADAARGMAR